MRINEMYEYNPMMPTDRSMLIKS